MTKVINLFGSPGSGKSTVASGLFYELKLKGLNVEMADEWIKKKIYEGTPYPFKDQLYASAKQNKRLREMVGKVDYIISDAPLLMGSVYSKNSKIFDQLLLECFNAYDNINFLLERKHKYITNGRFQNEHESDEIAKNIEKLLENNRIEYISVQSTQAVHRITEILNVLGIVK